MSPTQNVNPTLFVDPCEFLFFGGGDDKFTVLQLPSLIKWFLIQILIIHDNVSSQVVDKRNHGFDQMDELVHHPQQYSFTYS